MPTQESVAADGPKKSFSVFSGKPKAAGGGQSYLDRVTAAGSSASAPTSLPATSNRFSGSIPTKDSSIPGPRQKYTFGEKFGAGEDSSAGSLDNMNKS